MRVQNRLCCWAHAQLVVRPSLQPRLAARLVLSPLRRLPFVRVLEPLRWLLLRLRAPRSEPKRLSHPRLTFHYGYGKRRLVGGRVARAFEQQGGILLVIAVHHNSVEVLAHQLLDCSEWFGAGLDSELEFAQDLRHRASGFFLGAEEKS